MLTMLRQVRGLISGLYLISCLGVAMDTEPYPVVAGLLYGRRSRGSFRIPNTKWLCIRNRTRSARDYS